MEDVSLYVLDQSFKTIKLIDSFESVIWTDRYYEAGDFEIYVPANSDIAEYAVQDNYLWTKGSEHLMIIEGSEIVTNAEDGNKLIITGRSLESILNRRIVWTQTNYNGNLQNGIKQLLNDAFISPSIAERKIDNFVFEDSTDPYITGLTLDAQYTGNDIYEVITELCKSKQIGFKITLSNDLKFVFKLYYGENRSYDQDTNPYVVFSPNFENIINSDYIDNKSSYKNITLIAGEGEGTDRKTTTVGSGSGLARRELFTDARDISSKVDDVQLTDAQYIAKLQQRGTEKLTEYPIVKSFDGQVETSVMFKYGEDFFLGDVVQVVNDYGQASKSRITEMIISQEKDGCLTYPTFEILDDEEATT